MEKELPLSRTALVFGVLSIPLAFARHLVSLAVVLGALAIVLVLLGRWAARSSGPGPMPAGHRRATWALRTGSVGLACALLMWWLWASNLLLVRP